MRFKKAIPIVVSIMTTSILAPIIVSCNDGNQQVQENATVKVISNHGDVKLMVDEVELVNESPKIEVGKVVTFSITPDEGYELTSLSANDKDIKDKMEFTCEEGNESFVVKSKFTKVETKPEPEPEPVKKATITIEKCSGGKVELAVTSIDPNNVKLDTKVSLKATPFTGYELVELTVNGNSIKNTEYFVVKEYIDYVVKATFTKKQESTFTTGSIKPINIKGSNGTQLNAGVDNFETTNLKILDVQHKNCYAEDGSIRLSSGKNSGFIQFTLDQKYPISQINIVGRNYNDDKARVSVNCGDETYSNDFSNGSVFDLKSGTIADSFSISSSSKNRFIIENIILTIGEGEGTVDPTPDPNPEEATITLNKTGNGTVTLSKDKGFAGEIVKATITPSDDSYLSTVEFNGELTWLDQGQGYVSLKLKAGNNTLKVVFKEKTSGESGKFEYLYGNNRIKPTRGNYGSYDSYYEPVRGLKGPALKAGLNKLIKGHTTFSYKSLNDSMLVTDVDPFNSSNIIFTYEGSLKKGTAFNKEHTWAKSVGNFGTASGPGSDMHHLRPSDQNLNSTRSNFDFAEVSGGKDCGTAFKWSRPTMKGNYVGGAKFEPKDEFKGDVARMIFYMATRYEGGDGYVDLEVGSSKGNIGGIDQNKYYTFGTAPGLHGSFDDLYKWATTPIDPVSDFEVNRNNIIDEKYQHNRNPFIDHPEFIQMIYDKTYDGPGALNDK